MCLSCWLIVLTTDRKAAGIGAPSQNDSLATLAAVRRAGSSFCAKLEQQEAERIDKSILPRNAHLEEAI
jgi:hypothetical protein